MSWMDECQQQKHTPHIPSTKTECDYLYGCIKKRFTCAKISLNMVNSREIAGNTEEKEEEADHGNEV